MSATIPDFVSARNPCDITAQVINDPASFLKVAEALLADPSYGALVAPFPYAYDVAAPRIALLDELTKAYGKVTCVVWLPQWLEGPGSAAAEQAQRVALFRSMGSCFDAIAKWHWWAEQVSTVHAIPAALVPPETAESVGAVIDAAGGEMLTERADHGTRPESADMLGCGDNWS